MPSRFKGTESKASGSTATAAVWEIIINLSRSWLNWASIANLETKRLLNDAAKSMAEIKTSVTLTLKLFKFIFILKTIWLPRMESNHDSQIQNLKSYRLDDRAIIF